MRVSMHLRLPADGRMLPHTRHAVAGYLQELDLTAEERHDVVLAIDEACANVIRHAFPDGPPPPDESAIELTAELAKHSVEVVVEDRGVGFDTDVIDLRSTTPADAVSGRGLQIIRELMTTVEVTTNASGGTRLTMAKHLSA